MLRNIAISSDCARRGILVAMKRILFLAALAGSGCSIAFQEHLPATRVAHAEPQCSSSLLLPVIDGLAVAGLTGAAVYGAETGNNRGAFIAGPAIIAGIVYLASSGNGFKRVIECRRAREEWQPVATR